jgi:uncharacterized protein
MKRDALRTTLAAASTRAMLSSPLPALNDPEGNAVPPALPPIVDAHVHLFPEPLLAAIRDWLDRWAWPVRYRLTSEAIVEFLLSRGVERIIGLHYSHQPGLARDLNRFMARFCSQYPQVVGTATVFPGEEHAAAILRKAFDMGLVGVKLHAHVQAFSMDSAAMHEIYQVCAASGKPIVMHVGREPKSPTFPYPVDPYDICAVEALEHVLRQYPELRVCVPHLGADEFTDYRRLLDTYENIWLDIAMTQADYLPVPEPIPPLGGFRPDRVMYGTDFPQIPYAWDRELKSVVQQDLPDAALEKLLGANAIDFFRL